MTIIELRAKRNKDWEAAKAFAETHTTDRGTLSAEDNATYERMEQEIVDLGKEIQRRERQEAMDAELNKPVNKPLTTSPDGAKGKKSGRASNEYKEDFGRHLRGKAPIHNVLSESVDADGGYLVPEEFERQIVQGLDEANIIRSLAKVITTAHDRKIPIAVGHSVANWTAENLIAFHGFQSDVTPFIKKAHCIVHPSYHEGMSNTLLESCSMGRPIITSNIHGCLEAVEDGKNGFLCNVKDGEDLYCKIKQFIELPYEKRREMGSYARKFVAENFNKTDVVNKTIKEIGL